MSITFGWTVFSAMLLAQPGSADFPPARVAVVNIPAVSERYLKTAALEAKFEQRRSKLAEQRNALRDKIDRTRRSLQEELKPGTPEYEERSRQLAINEAELQWMIDAQGRQVEGELAASLRLIFDDLRAVLRQVADEKGIDVVLAADTLPESPPTTTNQARQQVVLQKVLFWRPRIDLTDEVVARLNEQFQAAQPNAAPGAAKPPAVDSGNAPEAQDGDGRPPNGR